jgi:hypothetical protein
MCRDTGDFVQYFCNIGDENAVMVLVNLDVLDQGQTIFGASANDHCKLFFSNITKILYKVSSVSAHHMM